MAMTLGGVSLDPGPSEIDGIIAKGRDCAHVTTYTSVGFYSWGASIVGKIVSLQWDYLSYVVYNQLQALLEADAQVVFDPDLGGASPPTYNVEILSLTGTYWQTQGTTVESENAYRTDVHLQLLIMSTVA